MKKITYILFILLLSMVVLQCKGKVKPPPPPITDPKYYFPINLTYKWTYVSLGSNCIITEDTFSITATSRNVRYIDGVNQSGWDMVSLPSGDTSFMFQVADTIFYVKSIKQSPDPYKIIVGPVEAGTSWKDRFSYDFDYIIIGFEDIYSSAAGVTYTGCVKIRRTSSDNDITKYFWWSPEWGEVKEVEFQSEQCKQGVELKYLDKTHVPP